MLSREQTSINTDEKQPLFNNTQYTVIDLNDSPNENEQQHSSTSHVMKSLRQQQLEKRLEQVNNTMHCLSEPLPRKLGVGFAETTLVFGASYGLGISASLLLQYFNINKTLSDNIGLLVMAIPVVAYFSYISRNGSLIFNALNRMQNNIQKDLQDTTSLTEEPSTSFMPRHY